ncbi:MAG: Asp-tRNA(Asn)/Glu-tRNA(Gln) amidotransferase subunit GatB [Candidatus Terrybacteria bacterium]|nr:Asp-tRNA(Asn)/Glu-tRNA(Gln) amidotransferase subunit GatB [Candidatus Terrybacteria bacterium]
MEYEPTIGLEIHVELKTKTKMFCNSLNDSDEKHPNVNVCPVCMGHPGTLPVINKEAVRKVLLVGKALNGKLAEYSQFDRKNYFYPDLPKGYQISQYKYPLVEGGELNGIKITRIHLEEDTGKLIHLADGSAVDFNRAGVPLMELVTEPEIKNGEEAKKFAQELQLILRYLYVSDADMEKGQMRVEVNISIRKSSVASSQSSELGTKVEIKNLNSFRAVERAIDYEIKRQAEILEKGEKVKQETRGWSALGGENKGETFSQREKEESHDYRYFPEPDLPPLQLSALSFQLSVPELPQQKRARFKNNYGISDEDIEMYVGDNLFGNFFEAVAEKLEGDKEAARLASNYIASDLAGFVKVSGLGWPTADGFAKLIMILKERKISSRGAKDILKIMCEKGGDPEEIARENDLFQMSDESAILELIQGLIKENPSAVEEYKKGKENSLQFLVGQGMRETKGRVNPEILKKLLQEKILRL